MPSQGRVATPRLNVNVRRCGNPAGEPILFIHGNLSSSVFWQETMVALQDSYDCIAPDLRGFGDTEPLKVDARLGLDDVAEDVLGLMNCLELSPCHVVGHSMGGGIAMKLMLAWSESLRSVTLVNTISPYGYHGSVDVDGSAGGAGYVEAELVRRLAAKDRSRDSVFSPRNVLEQLYFKPPFVPGNAEALLDSMLSTRIGDDWYPGDAVKSACGNGWAPGTRGIVNAMSRRFFDASDIVGIDSKPPVLWVRGVEDAIVRDEDESEEEEVAPQPMIGQTREVLDRYRARGGYVAECAIEDAGHTPFIEKPLEFRVALLRFLRGCHEEARRLAG